jgi:hypothetical protein
MAGTPSAFAAKGPSPITEERRFFSWLAGSSTDPFDHPELCGERVGGEFFLNVAVTPGQNTVDCVIPAGLPIVGSPGGEFSDFASPPNSRSDASLEAEVADLAAGGLTDFMAVLDGQDIAVPLRSTGAFTVAAESGSLIALVTGGARPVRLAGRAAMIRIDGLSTGAHTLVLSDRIDGELFEMSFNISIVG